MSKTTKTTKDTSNLKSLLQDSAARIVGDVRPLSSTVRDGKLVIVCRHPSCRNEAEEKRRGLCRSCYDNPAIRNLYPSEHRGRKDTQRGFALPAATAIEPGSDKVPVLIDRARAHQRLFLPLEDAQKDATARQIAGLLRYMDGPAAVAAAATLLVQFGGGQVAVVSRFADDAAMSYRRARTATDPKNGGLAADSVRVRAAGIFLKRHFESARARESQVVDA